MKGRAVPLSEAAGRLRCHPETLRRRIRAGRLEPAGRGPHGEYLISLRSLAGIRLTAGGRPRTGRRDGRGGVGELDGLDLERRLAANPAFERFLEDVVRDPDVDPEFGLFLDFRRLRAGGASLLGAARRLRLPERVAQLWDQWDLEQIEEVVAGRIRRRARALLVNRRAW